MRPIHTIAAFFLLTATCFAAGERAAIDAYLKENLDDGEYEVVKWMEVAPVRKSLVWDAASVPDPKFTRTRSTQFWKTVDKDGQALRLKFRSRNKLGAKVLADKVFMVSPAGTVFGVVPATDFRLPGESVEAWQKRVNYNTPTSDRGQDAWTNLLKNGVGPGKKSPAR